MQRTFFLILFQLMHSSFSFAVDFPALLYRTKGNVQIWAGEKLKPVWKNAKPGMGLMEKDKIRTAQNSIASVLLEDGSFYQIRENSELEISGLIFERKKKAQQSSLKVHTGTMLGLIQKPSRNSKAEILTPTALVAVRGTELAVNVEDEETTHIALFEGRIIVKDFVEERFIPREQEELLLEFLHELSLKAGEQTTVSKKGIQKAVKLKGKLQELSKEMNSIRLENQQAVEEQSKLSVEMSQSQRSKFREDALR